MDTHAELDYKINIEPQMFKMYWELAKEATQVMTKDQFMRSMWVFMHRLLDQEYQTAPEWMARELEAARQRAEASNTVEGEVGVDG